MIKFAAILSLILVSVSWARSQSPSPTPPPADETDVVKITTTLIQLDVTVKDRKGKVVTDLRPDEIEVYENGEKQKISNFSFISNIRSTEEVEQKEKKDKDTTVVLPPSTIKPDQVRRTIALVVDDLTLSFESTYQVRRALKKFVDEQMQEGDLVAIIRTGAGIGALQQFTNDKRQLYAAIERVRWNAIGSGGIGAFAPLEERMDEGPQIGERTSEEFQREFEDFRESLFATGTLGAINYVVRGMQELPGRKSILLLSDGFKLFVQESGSRVSSDRVMQSLRRLIDMANRASVVVYTMDARGLQFTGLTAADDAGGRTTQELSQEISSRRDRLIDTQEGLTYLAKQTGGIAYINQNDLSAGIRKILDDQSYYLIGYQPKEESFDPKTRRFNRVEIKVLRAGTTVRYRSGFFGVSDEKIARPQQTIEARMFHSLTSPFAINDIPLRLNALFYKPPNLSTLFVRSLVHVQGKDLTFTDEPDGGKKAVFDIVAAGFGDNGAVVEQISKTYTIVISKEGFARALKRGIVYEFTLPVKKAGAYQLRVALHDHGTDKIGSANQFVEVPNLKKNRLVLSGVILENVPYEEWQRRNAGGPVQSDVSDPLVSTSLRQFKRGTVLNYGFTIYNAKLIGTEPKLHFQTRVFRDGKQIFESSQNPVDPAGLQASAVAFSAALALGTGMLPGDYVLQVVITDDLAKAKSNSAMQFVQFEIIE